MLKISTVGLSWEIENDSVMKVNLSKSDRSSHEILKTYFIGDIPMNLLSFGFGITQIGRKTKNLLLKHCKLA